MGNSFCVAIALTIVSVLVDAIAKSSIITDAYQTSAYKSTSSNLAVAVLLFATLGFAIEALFSTGGPNWAGVILFLCLLGAIIFVFLYYFEQRKVDHVKVQMSAKLDRCGSIYEWLLKAQNAAFLPLRWTEIGQEVYLRKTLLEASARQLEETGFLEGKIDESVKDKTSAKAKPFQSAEFTQRRACFRLAATDVFVEKAQRLLSHRAQILMFAGTITAAISVLGMIAVAWWIGENGLIRHTPPRELLAITILKSSSAGALITAAFYLLVSLTRALLHEGTTLYARRHSLRFGRLYVYLNDGDIKFKDLKDAFQWNAEYKSAFKDINSGKVGDSLLKSLISSPKELAKFLAKSQKKYIDKVVTANNTTKDKAESG